MHTSEGGGTRVLDSTFLRLRVCEAKTSIKVDKTLVEVPTKGGGRVYEITSSGSYRETSHTVDLDNSFKQM